MSIVRAGERVAVFIDGQFFMKGLKIVNPTQRYDYSLIVSKLACPGRLTRAWYYDAPPPPYLDAMKIQQADRRMDRLRGLPFFEVRLGKLQKRNRRVKITSTGVMENAEYHEQKGVDVHIAIDMMGKAQRHEYDTAILVSGDSDFVEMVKVVKEMGQHVALAHGPAAPRLRFHPSWRLRNACDDFICIDSAFLAGCELAGGSTSARVTSKS